MTKSPYTILRVSPDANLKEIKSAYKRLTLLYHPDVNRSSDAESRFIEIVNAYKTLISMHGDTPESNKRELKPQKKNCLEEKKSDFLSDTFSTSNLLKKISIKFRFLTKMVGISKFYK